MDTNPLIRNKKHQKHREGKGKGKGESSSRLSDLPDQILHGIISLLPTKEAVQTSVLSKRWVDQWMRTISKIELEEGAPEKRQLFLDFMAKLFVISDFSKIEKLSLKCEVGEDAFQLNEWIYGFINPNKIQELNLDLERVEEPLVFPDRLFTCETLKNFQLSMQQVLYLPATIWLESLRTLTLKHVVFPDTSSTQELFSNCPSLEELTLIDCNYVNVRELCISSPLLQKLIIREWKDDEGDGYYKPNQENGFVRGHNIIFDAGGEDFGAFGQNRPNHCQIVIVGTKMKYFSFDGDLVNDYFLYKTTSVTEASIDVHPPQGNSSAAGFFVLKLLKALSHVQKLSLTDNAIEALCPLRYLLGHLPLFCNLDELRVVTESSIDLCSAALLWILRKSPYLTDINFVMGVSLPEECARSHIFYPLPACFGTHLKMIEISGFTGKEEELNAIRFLLQAAPVLDTLNIYSNAPDFDSPTGPKRLEKLYKLIVRFPRASVDCEIDLE